MEKTTEVCHFSISGVWITNLSRTLVLEKEFNKALNTLYESLDGISYDLCIEILRGNKKLIGINNLECVDEDEKIKENYNKMLDKLYNDLIETKDGCFKIYAVVIGGNKDDVYNVGKIKLRNKYVFNADNSIDDFYRARALYWANDQEHDFPYYVTTKDAIQNYGSSNFAGVYLFSKCNDKDIPFWRKPETDFKKVIINNRNNIDLIEPGFFVTACDANIKLTNVINSVDVEFSDLKRKIMQKAESNGGFIELTYKDENEEKIYNIPKNPFIHWACRRSQNIHKKELPAWTPISHSGYKMSCDDPCHTDFMIGMFDNSDEVLEVYSGTTKFSKTIGGLIWDLAYKVAEDFVSIKFQYINSFSEQPNITGKTFTADEPIPDYHTPVLILPNLSPKYLDIVLKTGNVNGVVLTEEGGKVAHVAIEALDKKITIIRYPKAMELKNSLITIDFDKELIRKI